MKKYTKYIGLLLSLLSIIILTADIFFKQSLFYSSFILWISGLSFMMSYKFDDSSKNLKISSYILIGIYLIEYIILHLINS